MIGKRIAINVYIIQVTDVFYGGMVGRRTAIKVFTIKVYKIV
jgi:hypothetical protein